MMFIVQPYDDELLSSWLFRLARQNHTNVSTMICHIFKNDIFANHSTKLHIKDIDLYPINKEQKLMLFNATGVEDIEKLQLFKFAGFLDEKIDRYRKIWIAEPKATKHNTKSFYGTRYCPKCLEEKVYIRQSWRMLLYNICEKHNCYLLCTCQSCNEKFMYYDNGYKRMFYQCYNCGHDLRKAQIMPVLNHKHINYQKKLLNILTCGYYKLNSRYYYSIGLFYFLRHFVLIIMSNQDIKIKYLKQLEPCQLSRYISHSLFLLNNFPYRLNRYYKKNKLTNIDHILTWGDRNRNSWNLPNWYLSGIQYRAVTPKGKSF